MVNLQDFIFLQNQTLTEKTAGNLIKTTGFASLVSENTETLNNFNNLTEKAWKILGFSIGLIILYLLTVLFGYLLYLSLYYTSIYSEKYKLNFKQAVKGGLSYFWKFLGLFIIILFVIILFFSPSIISFIIAYFSWVSITYSIKVILIVIGVFLFLLGLLFLMYFGVNWFCSPYILVREKIGVIESMRRSRLIVKGNWWRVFGYNLLFGLISLAILSAVLLPQFLINLLFTSKLIEILLSEEKVSFFLLFLSSFLGELLDLLYYLITMPWGIFFGKNLYMELRQKLRK